jgi:RecB family exonuclease
MDVATLKGCEVKYFIERELCLYEPEMLVHEIEPSLIGLKVHRIFTDLYREVNFDHLDASMLEENLNTLLEKHFRERFFYSREEDLVKKVLGEKLLASLRHDVERFGEGYRVCPEFIERALSADVSGGRYTITGRIDRVDRSPTGAYVLIDYKTGSIPVIAGHFEETGFSEVQLGFYGLLLRHTEPEAAIESLCYFDLSGDNRMKPIVEGEAVYAYLDGFEAHLIDFLDEVNGKSRLSLTASLDTCTYCPYYNICRIYEE